MVNQEKIAIKVENLEKSFRVVGGEVNVLKDISFEVKAYQFVIIYGPSGCGKSTLLHTILGLEKPNKGKITVLGKNLYEDSSEDSLAEFRKFHIGMVYQQPNWVKAINVLENVALPLALVGESYESRIEKATQVLKSVDMFDKAYFNPAELSSGQQQKVALARALMVNPDIIIADEPTGNLDYESGIALMKLLKKFSVQLEKTILMVTHDLEFLKLADMAVHLFDGKILKIYNPKDVDIEKDENAIFMKNP